MGGIDAPPRLDAPPIDARPDAPADAPFDGPPDAPLDAFVSPDAPPLVGPPVITLVSPSAGTLVAGVLRVEVDVIDNDGVTNVSATIAGTHSFMMAPVSAGSSHYVGFFDTLPLAGLLAPTIVVRATDTTMDTSQLGFEIILDNEGPISSLDPPNVRLFNTNVPKECSDDFDPLGNEAADDFESVPQLVELRARVADLSNTGTHTSSLFVPEAGNGTAEIYVLDDTTKPLVVDTNSDGRCDSINPTIVPKIVPTLANEAAVVDLESVTPSGIADFFTGTTFGGTNAMACAAGTAMAAPADLCLGEPGLTTVIKTPFTGTPEIYGIPPVDGSNCAGFAFDAKAANIRDGWACVAVLATDMLGNKRVSAPLRICVDSDGNGAECPPWGTISAAGAPNCTGTASGMVVTTTPCTPTTFPSSGVANEFELLPQ